MAKRLGLAVLGHRKAQGVGVAIESNGPESLPSPGGVAHSVASVSQKLTGKGEGAGLLI